MSPGFSASAPRPSGFTCTAAGRSYASCWRRAMDDLKKRLRVVERVEPPDVWERVEKGQGARLPLTQTPRHQRLLAAFVALALSAGTILGLWYAFGNRGVQPAGRPAGFAPPGVLAT